MRALSLAILMFMVPPAKAAEVTLSDFRGEPVIHLKGPFIDGDEFKFASAVRWTEAKLVLLHSDGGSLRTGIEIGRTIKRMGLGTLVSTLHGRCASACGLAWLAGTPRMIDLGSLVGFHAAYTTAAGKNDVTSIGNALAGGYMRELGLSDAAIEYATTARPESMTWLTNEDAIRIRLDVEYIWVGTVSPGTTKYSRKIPVPEPAPRRVKITKMAPSRENDLLKLFSPVQ